MSLLGKSRAGVDRLREKYPLLLSKTALVIGVILMSSGLSRIVDPGLNRTGGDPMGALVGGVVIVLSVLAYISAKKRRLGTRMYSTARNTYEIGLLGAMLAVVVLQNDVISLIEKDPVNYLILPLWGVIAYGTVARKQPAHE